MTPDAIRTHAPKILTEAQRETYFETGFLCAEGLIPDAWLRRLNALSEAFIDESRGVTESNEAFDIDPRHSSDTPHVRRLRALVDRHPDFWRFAAESPLADIAADLVGPDVKFHSSKLNYKWPGTGEIVQWHRDDAGAWTGSVRAADMATVDTSRAADLVGRAGDIVRGSPAKVAHLDPFPCLVPPDWSKPGYGSIFVAQKAEM